MSIKVKPFNRTVRFVNPITGLVDTALISAFCRSCGNNRGKPKLVEIVNDDGEPQLVHRWKNKCGHVDDDNSVYGEVELQCAAPDCVVMAASVVHFPYCGEECVMKAGLNVIQELRAVSTKMDGCITVLGALINMLEHPDAGKIEGPSQRLRHLDAQGLKAAKAIELWQSNVTQCADAITRAQMCIIEAIAHGMNAHSMEGSAKNR
jgi:hypothetical protein